MPNRIGKDHKWLLEASWGLVVRLQDTLHVEYDSAIFTQKMDLRLPLFIYNF